MRQRSSDRKDTTQHEEGVDTLAYDALKDMMSRYKADFKEVRDELLTVRAELVEARKVAAGLQEQVFILRAQNETLTRTVERLQASLDATKGDGK